MLEGWQASRRIVSSNKLDFHVNASLTSVNVARDEHWIKLPENECASFSMANIKMRDIQEEYDSSWG